MWEGTQGTHLVSSWIIILIKLKKINIFGVLLHSGELLSRVFYMELNRGCFGEILPSH